MDQLKDDIWLEARTIKTAISKIDRLMVLIGKSAENLIPPVKVQTSTYFDNAIAIKEYNFRIGFARLGELAYNQLWVLPSNAASTVNLLYSVSTAFSVFFYNHLIST